MSKEHYRKCKESGKCYNCGSMVKNSKGQCTECLKKKLNRYFTLRAKGLCKCGKKSENGKAMCLLCSTKKSYIQELRFKKRIESGYCITCGKRRINKKVSINRCKICLNKEKERRLKIRTSSYQRLKVNRQLLKIKVFMAYGGVECACCKETNPIFLSIDHTNNDGSSHRKLIGNDKIYRFLLKNNFPEGYQVLCHNCNRGKYLNGGTCPHRNKKSNKFNKNSDLFLKGYTEGILDIKEIFDNIVKGLDKGQGVIKKKENEKLRREILKLYRLSKLALLS